MNTRPVTRLTKQQLMRGAAHLLDPAVNLGLSLARPYKKPNIEFNARAVRDDPDERRRAGRVLRRAGAIVLRGYYDAPAVDGLRERADAFFAEVEWRRNAPLSTPPDPRFGVQNSLARPLKGYRECVRHPVAVVNFRDGVDLGMVDVFHPERLIVDFPGQMPLVDEVRERLVAQLVRAAVKRKVKSVVRNLYLNDSVTRTRGFHTDGVSIKAKSFTYMTDVLSDADGPYCYALGTHEAPADLREANQRLNLRLNQRWDDFPLHGLFRRFTFHGHRGDLIISLQFGAHRGLPQKSGHRRMMLVSTVQGR